MRDIEITLGLEVDDDVPPEEALYRITGAVKDLDGIRRIARSRAKRID